MKQSKLHKVTLPENAIHISSSYGMEYYMTVSPQKLHVPDMLEMYIDTPLHTLHDELESIQQEIKQYQTDLKGYSSLLHVLQQRLIKLLNTHHLLCAKTDVQAHLDQALFSIEGWIPASRLHSLFPLLEGLGVHAEEIAIEEGERVPTHMENTGAAAVGEDLVHIYDTPATVDKDPSGWVFWGFAVFFAMIISDAGYGLIFFLMSLMLTRKP